MTPTPDEIRALRHQLGDSQSQLAKRFNVSVNLVQAWEQDARKMRGASVRLFQIYQLLLRDFPGMIRIFDAFSA